MPQCVCMLNEVRRCPRYVDDEGETCPDHKNCRMISEAGYMSPRSSRRSKKKDERVSFFFENRNAKLELYQAKQIIYSFFPDERRTTFNDLDSDTAFEDIIKNKLRENPNAKNFDESVLHYLIRNGNAELIDFLIDNEVDLNVENTYGDSPLQLAIDRRYLNIIKLLVKNGARSDEVLCRILALNHDNVREEAGIILLENGADPNQICKDGRKKYYSLINRASAVGYTRMVKVLLKKGADPNSIDWLESTSIIEASINGHLDILKLLMKNGGKLRCSSTDGYTPLIAASENDHVEIVRMLLDPRYIDNVDINSKFDNSASALTFGALNDNVEIVEMLISKGADIESVSDGGYTPLLHAAEDGHTQVVKLLVENGANIHHALTFSQDMTAIKLAMKKRHDDIVEFLEKYTEELKDEMVTIFPDIVVDEVYNVRIVQKQRSGKRLQKEIDTVQLPPPFDDPDYVEMIDDDDDDDGEDDDGEDDDDDDE